MKHTRVCLVGAGRFGRALALELESRGCRVSVVDRDPSAIESLANKVDLACVGDVSDEAVLRDLRLEHFDTVLVAVGKHVIPSLAVASQLKELVPGKLACRIVDEPHRFALERMGCNRMIDVESLAASSVADELIGPKPS